MLGLAHDAYRRHEAYFPLIGAVLLDQQDGFVLVDDSLPPRRFYVEHTFGFAQVFGCEDAEFDEALRQYLVVEKSFAASKVRLYTPIEPAFLRRPEFAPARTERQRFILDPGHMERAGDLDALDAPRIEIKSVQAGDLGVIDERFGVVRRFWRSESDFIDSAHAVVAWVSGSPVSICYAAAIAEGLAEIDVLTLEQYRRIGLGKRIVHVFSQHCLSQGLKPVWDCFTNNAGSMALSKSCGFEPLRAAYPFYTLNK